MHFCLFLLADISSAYVNNSKSIAEDKEIVVKDKPSLAVRYGHSRLQNKYPERRSTFRNNNTNNNILSISYQH